MENRPIAPNSRAVNPVDAKIGIEIRESGPDRKNRPASTHTWSDLSVHRKSWQKQSQPEHFESHVCCLPLIAYVCKLRRWYSNHLRLGSGPKVVTGRRFSPCFRNS